MKAVLVKEWPSFLVDWAQPVVSAFAESPRRQELTLYGELPDATGVSHRFLIGKSRDVHGSLLNLTPARDHPLVVSVKKEKEKEREKDEKNLRDWNHWWAKIAVRSGYMSPIVDPSALELLGDLRHRNVRVEFIVDTNVLISGVGHWLVRYLGNLCDLVRTVVTDLEIQRFGDQKKWVPQSFRDLSARTNYLMSCRFLEYIQEQHPLWRRLDIEEETALFVSASTSKSGEKEPGSDTLLLRAVRRSIQDQVPGLVRLFVTSDAAVARTALHDLPSGATVAAYVNRIPDAGVHLSPIHWWPTPDGDGGGYVSNLASFVYEASSFCDAVILTKPNGAFLKVGIVDRNQFPSDWRQPILWVTTGEAGSAGTSEERPQPPSVRIGRPLPEAEPDNSPARAEAVVAGRVDARAGISIGTVPSETARESWPLSAAELRTPVPCAARASAPILLDVLAAIMLAVRERRPLSRREFPGAPGPSRELRTFLRAVEALDAGDQPGPAAAELPSIFAANSVDRLSQFLTKASSYYELIDGLRRKKASRLEPLKLPPRSATALAGLSRLLGQAVQSNDELLYGGGYISRDDFIAWFMRAVNADPRGPLGGHLLADIARKALHELTLSPARFERALNAVIKHPPISDLEFLAGGTPENVLAEEVAVLSPHGWSRKLVSADGLLGYRSIRRTK
jgi:hypothetical protein